MPDLPGYLSNNFYFHIKEKIVNDYKCNSYYFFCKEKEIIKKWTHFFLFYKKGVGIVIFIFIWLFLLSLRSAVISSDFLELRNQGKYQEALAELEKLIAAEPENYDYRLHQGIILSWLGKYSEAENILKKIIERYPDYFDARISLARIYFWQNLYSDAENQINYVLSKKSDHTEALELFEKIKITKQTDYTKSQILDNVLSNRNENKDISLIKRLKNIRTINLFSTLNVLRDYEPTLNRYPYKEITFRAGVSYTIFYKNYPLDIFYKTGYIKQINTNWRDNEYYLSINTLTINANYSFEKINLTSYLSVNHYNNQGVSYFKTSKDKLKVRPFILINREMTDFYKLYFAYSIEDWYKKSESSRSLFVEDLHSLSFSNVFLYRENYYLIDYLRAIYSNESVRNYSDYIIQINRLFAQTNTYDLRLNLKYKYRDYKHSHLQFYFLKTEYLSKSKSISKFEYKLGYELSLVKPYTTIGHKFETRINWKINETINLSNTADYFFQSAKDKDREYNVRLNLEYKY